MASQNESHISSDPPPCIDDTNDMNDNITYKIIDENMFLSDTTINTFNKFNTKHPLLLISLNINSFKNISTSFSFYKFIKIQTRRNRTTGNKMQY